jgi:hypothetical protein
MGTKYVTIVDNAEPQDHVLVYRRAKDVQGSRLVCAEPVFMPGQSNSENSLIATDKSIVVENNFGYRGIKSTLHGSTSKPGIARIDLDEDGKVEVIGPDIKDLKPPAQLPLAIVAEVAGAAARLLAPVKGDKKYLLQMAHENAEQFLLAKSELDQDEETLLEALKEKLYLKKVPHRIEAFDISNLQGGNAVGSMVCFEDGKPQKERYRHFRINTIQGADDTGMMYEVLLRRYRKVVEEKDLPDLVLLDGGRGQLNVAQEVFKELRIEEIDLIIPRGGEELIRFVMDHSKIPVIKHYKGVCHIFVDQSADLEMAIRICLNAKVQKPGVCNAMETLLVHEKVAGRFLPKIAESLQKEGVELRGCAETQRVLPGIKEAREEVGTRNIRPHPLHQSSEGSRGGYRAHHEVRKESRSRLRGLFCKVFEVFGGQDFS